MLTSVVRSIHVTKDPARLKRVRGNLSFRVLEAPRIAAVEQGLEVMRIVHGHRAGRNRDCRGGFQTALPWFCE